jgi:hypothetical protein
LVSAGYLAAYVNYSHKIRFLIFAGQGDFIVPALSGFKKNLVKGDVHAEVKIFANTHVEIACYETTLSLTN